MVSRLDAAVGLLLVVAVVGLAGPSVNALPGFSDHTGPTEATVVAFERGPAGCADQLASRSGVSVGANGSYERTGFVRTGDRDANLSVRVERTSPTGADLSTFRVHVDADGEPDDGGDCRVGVRYRLELRLTGGSPPGLVPDAHGTRVVWLHDGRYVGCSASVTSPLDAECDRIRAELADRTWRNATGS